MALHQTSPTVCMHGGVNRDADTNPHRDLYLPREGRPTTLSQPLWYEDDAQSLQGDSMLLHR